MTVAAAVINKKSQLVQLPLMEVAQMSFRTRPPRSEKHTCKACALFELGGGSFWRPVLVLILRAIPRGTLICSAPPPHGPGPPTRPGASGKSWPAPASLPHPPVPFRRVRALTRRPLAEALQEKRCS